MAEFFEELIVALAGGNKPLPLRDDRKWHLFLYRLKSGGIEPRPDFLDRVDFDWDAPFPRCRMLSEFLQALHWNECVAAVNPSFEVFTVDESLRRLCNERQKDQQLTQFLSTAAELGRAQLVVS